jgi:hypothetical protein
MIPLRYKWPLAILSLLLIAQFLYFREEPKGYCEIHRRTYYNASWKGIINNKFIDVNNHKAKTIVINGLNSIDTILLSIDKGDLFNSSVVGDSVLKTSSSLEVTLISSGNLRTRHHIQFNCE